MSGEVPPEVRRRPAGPAEILEIRCPNCAGQLLEAGPVTVESDGSTRAPRRCDLCEAAVDVLFDHLTVVLRWLDPGWPG